MKDKQKELLDRLGKLQGLSEELNADTATIRDQVKEEMATEQEHLKEVQTRMQGGEDTRELVTEYVDAMGRLGQLHDWLAELEDDIEENHRYSGRRGK